MSSFPIQSSVVLQRLKPFGISMEKSLSDLIKGIRAHSKESPESLLEFLNDAVNECRDELNTTDLEVKATAILKLTYLEMYGFDMSWCNFHILEVMSSSKFQQKRIGYLAAIQSLKSEPELLILATNQFKKDLNSHNHVEVGLALSGIATIVSPPLAKDILDDVVMKLSHSKPYIRKKAVLALFKVFLQYPESLRSTLPRVIDKLDDPDVAVVSATITIICEISKKNPKIFVSYLPKFFSILEETSNNWLIIRILKLFQSLLKIEPRMKKKIMPSILNLLGKTEATSLVYECINCIVNGGMISGGSSKDKEVAKICIDHLMKFFDTRDSNLKFVGLLALIKILEYFPTFIYKVDDISSIIMLCLADGDMIIKRKALEICHYLATEDNMAQLVKTLLLQLVPDSPMVVIQDSLKLEITKKILQIASADNYSTIPNFKWYVTALKELANLTLLTDSNKFTKSSAVTSPRGIQRTIAVMIGKEFKSVSTKVPSIRPYVLHKVVMEYTNTVLPLEVSPQLMKSIYWIMGEYVKDFGIDEDDSSAGIDVPVALGQKISIFNNILNCYIDEHLDAGDHFAVSNRILRLEEPEVLTVLFDSIIKLFNGILADYNSLYSMGGKMPYKKLCEIGYFLIKVISFLEHWQHDSSFEVQERCLSWLEYLRLCKEALEIDGGIELIEAEEIKYFKEKFENEATKINDGSTENSEDIEECESEEDDSNSDSDDDSERDSNDDEVNEPEASSKVNEGEFKSEVTSVNSDGHSFVESSKEPRQIPSILSQVLPSFFESYQLNPIAVTAQSHIAVPDDLDLESQINDVPAYCFEDSTPPSDDESLSADESDLDTRDNTPDEVAHKERMERLKDDPYYISGSSKKSKTKQRLLNLDADSLRVTSMSPTNLDTLTEMMSPKPHKKSKKLKKEKVVILLEETLGDSGEAVKGGEEKKKKKKSKLIIDSFGLENLNLDEPETADETGKDYEYDVDLKSMRQEMEKKSHKDVKKSKKKKGKTVKLAESAKETPMETEKLELSAEPLVKVEPVAVTTNTKTKKKKKRAIIED